MSRTRPKYSRNIWIWRYLLGNFRPRTGQTGTVSRFGKKHLKWSWHKIWFRALCKSDCPWLIWREGRREEVFGIFCCGSKKHTPLVTFCFYELVKWLSFSTIPNLVCFYSNGMVFPWHWTIYRVQVLSIIVEIPRTADYTHCTKLSTHAGSIAQSVGPRYSSHRVIEVVLIRMQGFSFRY